MGYIELKICINDMSAFLSNFLNPFLISNIVQVGELYFSGQYYPDCINLKDKLKNSSFPGIQDQST